MQNCITPRNGMFRDPPRNRVKLISNVVFHYLNVNISLLFYYFPGSVIHLDICLIRPSNCIASFYLSNPHFLILTLNVHQIVENTCFTFSFSHIHGSLRISLFLNSYRKFVIKTLLFSVCKPFIFD